MSGQVHAGRLRLPKVWHAVSFVPVAKVTLFTLESLRAGRNEKIKSLSWTCLTRLLPLKSSPHTNTRVKNKLLRLSR